MLLSQLKAAWQFDKKQRLLLKFLSICSCLVKCDKKQGLLLKFLLVITCKYCLNKIVHFHVLGGVISKIQWTFLTMSRKIATASL